MSNKNLDVLNASWEAFGKGDWDGLASHYSDDMIFVFPGQTDVLQGKQAFREALENISAALPPGLEITGMRHIVGEDEIVDIVDWKAAKIPDGTQTSILFRFNENSEIIEERWFLDTTQWNAAM